VSETGSFAEESARLLGAFQDWVAKGHLAAKDLAAQGDSATSATDGGAGAHGPECGICPICQGIALVRGARPEVVEHLSDAVTSLAAALAALFPAEAESPARRRQERVQHIDVSGDDVAGTAG
jgi:hypothetical protein